MTTEAVLTDDDRFRDALARNDWAGAAELVGRYGDSVEYSRADRDDLAAYVRDHREELAPGNCRVAFTRWSVHTRKRLRFEVARADLVRRGLREELRASLAELLRGGPRASRPAGAVRWRDLAEPVPVLCGVALALLGVVSAGLGLFGDEATRVAFGPACVGLAALVGLQVGAYFGVHTPGGCGED